jgi:hypothetical protein
MQSSAIPIKIPVTWATGAPGGDITYPVPTPSQITITPGRASWTDGFVPANFLPSGSGGIPPFGADFNGVFAQLSQWVRWQNAGGPVFYDGTFSSAIGGYPKWTTLANASTPGKFWTSTVENNASDPDTGGSNWLDSSAVGGSLSGNLPNPTISNSGVTAGSYISADITVGADGRVTAAAAANHAITVQTFSAGATGTYTAPGGVTRIIVELQAGGGGGATTSGNGGTGGTSVFGSWTTIGGTGGLTSSPGGAGGSGGSNGTGTQLLRVVGFSGTTGAGTSGTSSLNLQLYAQGGAGTMGGGLGHGGPGVGTQLASGTVLWPGGGGGGEYVRFQILAPSPAVYAVGLGGTSGIGGGGPGLLVVYEYYD